MSEAYSESESESDSTFSSQVKSPAFAASSIFVLLTTYNRSLLSRRLRIRRAEEGLHRLQERKGKEKISRNAVPAQCALDRSAHADFVFFIKNRPIRALHLCLRIVTY